MGCSDFSTRPYSYDDVPDDFELRHFMLAEEDLKMKVGGLGMWGWRWGVGGGGSWGCGAGGGGSEVGGVGDVGLEVGGLEVEIGRAHV